MRRRFTRCILRSEAASTSGALEDARSALDEARALFPDAPEIAVLDRRIAEGRDRSASPMMPLTTAPSLAFEGEDDDSPVSDGRVPPTTDAAHATPEPASLDRGRALLTGLPLAVIPLALAGVLGIGVGQIGQPLSHLAEPPAGLLTASIGIPARVLPDSDAVAPVTAVGTTGARTSEQRNPRPPSPSVLLGAAADGDDGQIRAMLKRFERAYNRINDKAAIAVWPGAESRVIEHTLDPELSRRISLGVCDITMTGEVGVARCAGTAAPDPKIGGGAATSQRYWAFDLRKDADGWRIEQLKVE